MCISDWSSDVCSSDLAKTPESALAMAEEYFEDWFPGAMQKYEGAKFHIEKRHLKPAAFDLPQTAEMLYHCILLVETFYTPHVHNLIFLRKQVLQDIV